MKKKLITYTNKKGKTITQFREVRIIEINGKKVEAISVGFAKPDVEKKSLEKVASSRSKAQMHPIVSELEELCETFDIEKIPALKEAERQLEPAVKKFMKCLNQKSVTITQSN